MKGGMRSKMRLRICSSSKDPTSSTMGLWIGASSIWKRGSPSVSAPGSGSPTRGIRCRNTATKAWAKFLVVAGRGRRLFDALGQQNKELCDGVHRHGFAVGEHALASVPKETPKSWKRQSQDVFVGGFLVVVVAFLHAVRLLLCCCFPSLSFS